MKPYKLLFILLGIFLSTYKQHNPINDKTKPTCYNNIISSAFLKNPADFNSLETYIAPKKALKKLPLAMLVRCG